MTSVYEELEFDLPGRPDKVLVMPLDDTNCTGIITYVKVPPDGNNLTRDPAFRYVHTLNTRSGFRRKLEAIGLTVTDSRIVPQGEND